MLFTPRSKTRPFHLGPFPYEALPRDEAVVAAEVARPFPDVEDRGDAPAGPLGAAARRYRDLFDGFREEEPAPTLAPLPPDTTRRAVEIKGGAYFLDAAGVGICRIPETAWSAGSALAGHTHAIVVPVEHGRVPEPDNPAHGWVAPAVREVGEMRAAEIAICLARHIRMMGLAASAHFAGSGMIDIKRLAVLAGLALREGEGIVNPFLGNRFSLAAVSTAYALATDLPLAAGARGKARSFAYWRGIGGAVSGRERRRRAKRAAHLGPYPMEGVRRVARPTTLILDDEVPRVPKRAAFFERALKGDLGEKSRRERARFALKHPFAWAMGGPIRAMVPLQDRAVAEVETAGLDDPATNARALKTLSYFLGADVTGICEVPRYAWLSHQADGTEIVPKHRYAVVMLIDQGFETMEGASGDDWISGAQSMRAYMRGAEIAGIMADCLRDLGVPARPQTNTDSDVLHIPLVLWAGLGEMSRIGELVLNPFLGPRSKSVVMTTDMPLAVDPPIDFGLQVFCSRCFKCARECPCDAIPLGPKVMFNGYETWKPDVERCARYRLTNAKGSACGRCMKTCPINKMVTADSALLPRLGNWLGIHAQWLKPILVPIATRLDDLLGFGRRVAGKKWWFDHEVVDGVTVVPRGVNSREIDPGCSVDPARQKLAIYPAAAMPAPDAEEPRPVDRKAALAATAELETPDEARARKNAGGAAPAHYTPTPPRTRRPASQ